MAGLRVQMSIDGRTIITESGESFLALIEDVPMLQEPVEQARSKFPVYVNVTAIADDVNNPRVILQMNEQQYGTMRVLKFMESRGDQLTYKWLCEAQRQ